MNVLEPLYIKMRDNSVGVDLGSLWTQLGVQSDGAGVRFDDSATLAAVRRAITTRESAAAPDPTFSSSSQYLLAGPWVPVIGLGK